METFFHLSISCYLFQFFNLNLMKITRLLHAKKHQSHWWWNHSHMQSPPFRILSISNSHPHQPTPPPPSKQGQGQGQQQLVAIQSQATNRVSRHRGGGEGKGKRSTGSPQKQEHLHRRQHTLLIVPMRLSRLFQPEGLSMIPVKMYLQTIWELHATKEKVKQRKECLWKLCYKEMAGQQPLPSWLLQDSPLQLLAPPVPKGLPQGTTLLIKEWLLWTARRKRQQGVLNLWLVNVNGGLCMAFPYSPSREIRLTRVQCQNQTWSATTLAFIRCTMTCSRLC